MLDEIDYILSQLQGRDFSSFNQDATLTQAFVRSLEIIGEAAKKIPEELRAQQPDIEWPKSLSTKLETKLATKYSVTP